MDRHEDIRIPKGEGRLTDEALREKLRESRGAIWGGNAYRKAPAARLVPRMR